MRLGFTQRARRLACCGSHGQKVKDANRHEFYLHFRCGLRFCPNCWRMLAGRAYKDHVRLARLIPKPLPPGHVIALLDFTLRNDGKLPSRKQIRATNQAIRRVLHQLLRHRKDWGYIYCDEFGFDNTNLHIHGLYYGPRLSQEQLSKEWLKATGDSFVVSIKRARCGFRQALRRMFIYASKPPSQDP